MIVKDVDLNSDKWCDLVFEGKNQEYGAYYLRKTSSKRHLRALSVVIIPILLILFLFKFIHFNPSHSNLMLEVKAIELSNLGNLEDSYHKEPEKPPVKKVMEYAPAAVVEADSIVNNPKEELQEANVDSLSEDSIAKSLALKEEEDAFLMSKEKRDTTSIDENDKDAEFPGGKVALIQYIYQHIQYPPAALKQRITGRVVFSFIVNEDGSISGITLIRGVYIFLDEEVLRVLHSLPPWKPAMKNGKPVKSKVIVPIVFRL